MSGTAFLYEDDVMVEDRTGGYTAPGSGFERLREDLAAKRTLSGTTAFRQSLFQQPSKALTTDELAQALLKAIETLLLPNDVRRITLYDSIARAVLNRIQRHQDYLVGEEERRNEQSEQSEAAESIRAAKNMFGSMPVGIPESDTAYMDETEHT